MHMLGQTRWYRQYYKVSLQKPNSIAWSLGRVFRNIGLAPVDRLEHQDFLAIGLDLRHTKMVRYPHL